MGPLSYMRSVVDWDDVMQRIPLYCSTPFTGGWGAVLYEKPENAQLVEESAPLQNREFQRRLNNSLFQNHVPSHTIPKFTITINPL